ncbi:hypothetical protein HRG_002833 [Hirsutella rhossiliensis]|uniref:Uncharacterized protein n=1 Tax=Hirsutella rhossiliensis TaxID=111463 RepID=A0A9P8N0T2_9HYPO|nr:uncharacterized protein HRG_02833 [Hirsutella rhossiliensis]KAH0964817.1 hypothetical protein HRG_02833 [Hirsutella rhossiliensis]
MRFLGLVLFACAGLTAAATTAKIQANCAQDGCAWGFRDNYNSGNLSRGEDRIISGGIQNYPKNIFTKGPECGSVNGGLMTLTPHNYEPVCACVKS